MLRYFSTKLSTKISTYPLISVHNFYNYKFFNRETVRSLSYLYVLFLILDSDNYVFVQNMIAVEQYFSYNCLSLCFFFSVRMQVYLSKFLIPMREIVVLCQV